MPFPVKHVIGENGLLAYYKLLVVCAGGPPCLIPCRPNMLCIMAVPRLVSFLLCESLYVHRGKHVLQKTEYPKYNIEFETLDGSLSFMSVQTCRVQALQNDYIHTKFCSHSPRNCWNFWDIRSWALPTALRTFPSTEDRTKINTHTFETIISEASCYSSCG